MYSIQVPTATQVFDTDGFTFSYDDNAAPQNRLANYRSPAFISFGERNVKIHLDRDFIDRTEYDTFKALTASSVTVNMANGSNSAVNLKAAAAIRDNYALGGLSGQGDLIRAGVDWVGIYDANTSKSFEIQVTTTENIS
jgi:hypothetical protein